MWRIIFLILALVPFGFSRPQDTPDGGVDCVCKSTSNTSNNYVCRCESDTGFDCTCKADARSPNDYVCKCPSKDPGFDCFCKEGRKGTDDYFCKCVHGRSNVTVVMTSPEPTPAGANGTDSPNTVPENSTPVISESNGGVPDGPTPIPIPQATDNGTAAQNDVPTPFPGNNPPATNPPLPLTKTYVICVKRDPETGVPVSDFLTDSQGKSVKIYGQWVHYECKSGPVDAFVLAKDDHDRVRGHCKENNFLHAQPSDDQHSSSYPFVVDGVFTDYYRQKTPFTFNFTPSTPIDRCTGSDRRRQH